MASTEISNEREIFSVCYRSCGRALSQSENLSCSWACPTATTLQTDVMTSPTATSIHSDPQARDLAAVLGCILKSPTPVISAASDQFSFLPDFTDSSSLVRCYGGDFLPLADSQKQIEEYVHELDPALQAIANAGMIVKGHCQEATRLAGETALARRAGEVGWSHTQSLANTSSNRRTEEVDRSMNIGSVVSQQYLHQGCSVEVSLSHASDGIEDLLSCDSGTFSNFESLEADCSSQGRVEIDKTNAFSDGNIVDSTSELITEDGVPANAEGIVLAGLSLCVSEAFNQNCVVGGIRDEPSSVFSSDSVLTPDSTNEMEEIQKIANSRSHTRPSATETDIQAAVESHGANTLQATALSQPCRSAVLQPIIDQNMAMIQGFGAMPQATEARINFSSPLNTLPALFTTPPAPGLLSAGKGDALPNNRASMRELAYRVAAFQPINWSKIEGIARPKRRNVRISKDPQSIAARRRREKISDRIRILRRLVPGGTRMDTASMLDEAVNYMKFLKTQVESLHRLEMWSNRLYSNHHLFDSNSTSNNNFDCHNFRSELPTNVSQSTQLNPHALHFPAFDQPAFPCFSPDQNLYQQPCH